jgi:hypothetical protein
LLEKYNLVHADLEQNDSLDSFFCIMTNFNKNLDLNDATQKQIRNHFNYRWEHDRNQAVDTASDKLLLDQLPLEA